MSRNADDAAAKRALLIASPFGGLCGPLNDIGTMAAILHQKDFIVSKCSGNDATRQGILEAWQRLIDACSSSDVVVVYYSGRGGITEDDPRRPNGRDKDGAARQDTRRFRFIVPVDFQCDLGSAGGDEPTPFKGILDVELESMLRATTERTRNVTTIFDCSYSSRIAFDPSYQGAVPRSVPKFQFAVVLEHLKDLRAVGGIPLDTHLRDNQHAVRITAAGFKETAWEHEENGKCVGVMTQQLAHALREWEHGEESQHQVISWRTMLMRVREMVNIKFSQQNPHVEGPDSRLIFSLDESQADALVLYPDGVEGILRAGRLSGVREDNVYTLLPLLTERMSEDAKIGTATITSVKGLEARASLLLSKAPIPGVGAIAFLELEAPFKWPVVHPNGPDALLKAIDDSKFLRRMGLDDSTFFAEFRQDESHLSLADDQGRLLSREAYDSDPTSWDSASKHIIKQAEQLARAKHLLGLSSDASNEVLEHTLAVTFGTIKDGKPDRIIDTNGKGIAIEGESVYISLINDGIQRVYVSVFDINATGKISLVSSGAGRGIEIAPKRAYHVGAGQQRESPQGHGLSLSWPQNICKTQPVNETLVLVLTDSPVDLRLLVNSAIAERGAAGPSSLEQLIFRLTTGAPRDMNSRNLSTRLHYDILKIPFMMKPRGASLDIVLSQSDEGRSCLLSSGNLPLADELIGAYDLPTYPPYLEQSSRGIIGGAFRTVKGVPACVWVVNDHHEDILVVVSRYRPERMLTGGGLNVSATGVGIELSSTSFQSPACKKVLAASLEGKGKSIGVFPLWTRKEGFGMISIFKGLQQKELVIENDRVPLGATALFANGVDLKIMDYKGNEICQMPNLAKNSLLI